MLCNFAPHDVPEPGLRRHVCTRCGYVTKPIPDLGQRIKRRCDRKGLGDYLAYWLVFLGITKARVRELVGGECGCESRQQALNRIGWELSDRWASALKWLGWKQ